MVMLTYHLILWSVLIIHLTLCILRKTAPIIFRIIHSAKHVEGTACLHPQVGEPL